MITIIAGTNRPGSMTDVIAEHYAGLLKSKGADFRIFSLSQLPRDFAFTEYEDNKTAAMERLVAENITSADKFVFVIPEYNGSYPGILKAFIDSVSPKVFWRKKAGIIGISDGHLGNVRGQEHLTSVLIHLKLLVHYMQPKISRVDKLMDTGGKLTDERALQLLSDHADAMITF